MFQSVFVLLKRLVLKLFVMQVSYFHDFLHLKMHDLIFHSFIKFTLEENEKRGKRNQNQMLTLTVLFLFSNGLYGSLLISFFFFFPHQKGRLLLSLGISA